MNQRKASIPILFASLVIVMLGFGIVIPLMPFYITHFNASGSELGLVMSLYSIMQFIFAPIWGRIADRIGRKPVLLIGAGGFVISFILQGLAQDLTQFIVFRTLAGVLSSATLPAAMAYIADTTSDQDRSKGMGLMGAGMGLGMVIGPSLGGILTKITLPFGPEFTRLLQTTTDPSTGAALNLSIPFFAAALLALLSMPLVQFFLPESLTAEKRREHLQETSAAPTSSLSAVFQAVRGPIGFLYLMAFVMSFALTNMEAVLALYGKQQFSMGPSDVGFLMGGMGLMTILQQGVMIGPLTRKFGEVRVIQAGLGISTVGFVALAVAPVAGLYIAAALLFNAGSVLLQPSVSALISRRARGGQGTAMGVNNSFQSLGRAFGPLYAGTAFDIYPTLSFWSGALIQAVVLVYS
ncbi:MAG TPA: MFS transporter, partial [Anaerolineaceae bacterium]|nr:MFS transporter [Anaerolineaceae bacterium]